MEFFTIGVYNTNEEEYFNKLTENGIDTFCDIRQRRGVRGAKYAFVNSIRLQQKLAELEIKYGHELGLAPTSEIREKQKQADVLNSEQKRTRTGLGEVFKQAYTDKILVNFDFDAFIERLENTGANKVVLFCVEERPEACHRSIVTKELESLGYQITHL